MEKSRLHRILAADGRSVIVAMDHAAFFGPLPGLREPGRLVRDVVAAGADAILTTAGIAARFAGEIGRAGLIVRADGGNSARAPQPAGLRQTVSVERALRLGADAMICMGMIGFPEEPSSLQVLSGLVDACSHWQMPVVAEMLVQRADGNPAMAEDVAFATRIGAELGADLIKTSYVPPVDEYRQALSQCYVPVVVLGGSKSDTDRSLLDGVAQALEAGAAGVAVGRNVWQHANPAGMTRALVALVHGGSSVEEALQEF